MNLKDTLLFKCDTPIELGIGFHNMGSGVLRYADENLKASVEKLYSQRCGHLPICAQTLAVLVKEPTTAIRSQIAYLSELYDRQIRVVTPNELSQLKTKPLIVPYITVPEVEDEFAQNDVYIWGLPGKLTHILKNKYEFYRLVNAFKIDEFRVPEHTTTSLAELIPHAKTFLDHIESLYTQAGVQNDYPLGVVIRAADEDSNYGSSLLYKKGKYVIMIPNGEVTNARVYGNWEEALVNSKCILAEAMQTPKEPRIVLTRYIDHIDSPGMSVVILGGQVFSLGWNLQAHKDAGRNAISVGSYQTDDPEMRKLQQNLEQRTVDVVEKFLRRAAERCKIDFDAIQGIANFDLLIPSALEQKFLKQRGENIDFYYSECNPRWTTYTDAIMTVLGAQKKDPTVNNMLQVIKEGIAVVDKYKLPSLVEPKNVREQIFIKDQELQKSGTRIICRMTTNPMSVIYTGDIELAQTEMRHIVKEAASQTAQAPVEYFLQ